MHIYMYVYAYILTHTHTHTHTHRQERTGWQAGEGMRVARLVLMLMLTCSHAQFSQSRRPSLFTM